MSGDAVVAMRFADGSEITSFSSFSLEERFSDALDSFDCVLTPPQNQIADYEAKTRKGEVITMTVNGLPQCGMMIEGRKRHSDPDEGVTFEISAISPLKILVESSIDPAVASKAYEADVPVLKMIEQLTAPYGFKTVGKDADIDTLSTKTGVNTKSLATSAYKKKHNGAQAFDNETVYGFITKVLSQLGCMLRCDPLGQLYIATPHYDGEVLYTVKQSLASTGPQGDRFFGKVSITETNAGQYSVVKVMGESADEKDSPRSGNPFAEVLTTDINASHPPFRASGPFPYKPKFYKGRHLGSKARTRAIGLHLLGRLAETAFTVEGRVHGLVSRSGVPWTVDTLGRVYVEPLGHDEVMWLASRRMSMSSANDGQETSLVWIPKGYLVLGDVNESE